MARKMSEAARAAQRDYMKEWRRKNRDKAREHQVKYWERRGRELLEKQASQ